MKKLLCLLCLFPVLLVAPASTNADGNNIVWDDNDPNAYITHVTLRWSPNTEQNIAGYNVYYGRNSGTYTRLESVTDVTAIIGVQGNRTVYFAVTAFDTSGQESAFSEEVDWP
jgi:hypothetical protein